MFLEFLGLHLAPVQSAFDAVLVALLRSTRVPFAIDKFTIQQASEDAEDMSHPSELGLDEDGFDVGGFSTVHDFKVGDMMLPVYS